MVRPTIANDRVTACGVAMNRLRHANVVRYGSAAIVVLLATIARLALDPVLGDLFPFATLFFAVLIVAGYAGRGPALLATVLGAVASARFLLPPRDSFAVHGVENQAGLVLYLTIGLGIAILGGALQTARRRAEADADEAARQRERSQITLASIGDAVLVTDAEGRVTSLNPVAEALTGWSAAEAVGQPLPSVFRIVNEETRRSVENPALRALREGAVVGLANHTLLISKDGTERPIDDSAAPIRDRDGRVVGVVLVFRDVSDRKRSEAEARRAGERARTILESITDAFFALDRDWRFTYVNRQAEALLGRSREDLLGKSLWEEYPETLGNEIERYYRRGMEGGESLTFENFFPPHDRWYENHHYPSPDGLSVYFRDVTERRRHEEHFRREREWLSVTLSSIGDAVIATDGGGRVKFMNPVAEALTGWMQGEATGRPLAEVFAILNEETRRSAESPVDRVLREGAVVGLANHTVVISRDRTETAIEDSAAPFKDASGGIIGVVLVFRDATEQRRHEALLRESEARKAAVLQTALDAIITIDHEGKVVEWNPAAETTFGHARSEVVGREMCELIVPPSLRDSHRKGMSHYLATGEGPVLGKRIEITAMRADGSEFPVELAITRISADGPPLFTAHVRDITERKAVEEALRDSEGRFRGLMEQAPFSVQVLDPDGRTLRVNRAWEGLWGLTLDQIADYNILEDPQLEAKGLLPSIRRAFAGEATAVPAVLYDPNETLPGRTSHEDPRRWVSSVAYPLKDASGRVREVVLVHEDITARKGAEGALQAAHAELEARVADRTSELSRANEFLRALLESIQDGIVACDGEGVLTLFNRATQEFHGLPTEPLPSDRWAEHYDLFGADGRTRLSTEEVPLFRALRGERVQGVEMVIAPRDGPVRTLLASGQAFRDDKGRTLGAVVSMHDITARKAAEAALRRAHDELELRVAGRTAELRVAKDEAEAANRAKTQFLAVLSHELRTPLNPILLAASSMLDRPCDPEEIRPTLEMIRQNVNLQARLIDDLLDVMRIVQGKMPLHWEVADCHRIIEQAIEICRSEFSGHDLRLAVESVARRHHVNADSARLQQVFWNLIKNAVKFTPEGGTITVRTRNEGGDGEDRIVVEVIDTGIGIEPEVLPRIWDPFQQGETTITRKFGGLGLGLAICKGVVEAHGGLLEAESPGKDRGTTFRVALKALPEEAVGGNGQPAGDNLSVAPHRPSSLRILVVEDEPATLRLMARLLRGLGHAVTTAGTIASGYEAFEAGEFDLIVSDIGLPDGTGLELMRRVVALRGQVPAIALTGYGMEDDIVRSREAGFTAHMTKPIDFTKLEAMIRQVASGNGQGEHA